MSEEQANDENYFQRVARQINAMRDGFVKVNPGEEYENKAKLLFQPEVIKQIKSLEVEIKALKRCLHFYLAFICVTPFAMKAWEAFVFYKYFYFL